MRIKIQRLMITNHYFCLLIPVVHYFECRLVVSRLDRPPPPAAGSPSGAHQLVRYTLSDVVNNTQGTTLDIGNWPTGVAVDPWGRIYVCNTGSKTVDIYDGSLAPLFSLGLGTVELVFPTSVAVDSSGTAFVADSKDNRIKVFSSSGSFLNSFGGKGSGGGYLNFPVSVAINETTSEVIVADLQQTMTGYRGAGIQVFTKDGTFRRRFGGYGEGTGLFLRPMGLAVDGSGRIYISDSYQNVVQVFDANGGFLLGVFDRSHPVRTPMGLAYCRNTERLFVASLNTARVEVFGDTLQGDSGGGQTVPLSFHKTGGFGCSMAGNSLERGNSVDAWIFLGIVWMFRRSWKRKRMARTSQ